MPHFDLTVIGDCNVDMILTADDLTPDFGQVEKFLDDARLEIGGSAAITSLQAIRLGLKTQLISAIGDDLFGEWLLDELVHEGVDITQVKILKGEKTGMTICFVKGSDRAMLTYLGAIGKLDHTTIDIDRAIESSHVHLSSYFLNKGLHSGLVGICKALRGKHITVSLDPNWDPMGKWDSGIYDVISNVDFLLANESEVDQLASNVTNIYGQESYSAPRASDIIGNANMLAKLGLCVVVKRAELGAFAVWEQKCAPGGLFRAEPNCDQLLVDAMWPIPKNRKYVDSIGAGDSFDGGFIFGLLHGESIRKSVEIGCFCGTTSTLGPGGTSCQATLDDLQREFGLYN